jgi:pimeloyl-ACP methyl ester carboxylesterase
MLQLKYKTFGQGEPVIILHGLFGTADNWQTIGKRLSEQYSVFLPDQRNHGRSPHDPDMNYELMADDLLHFMESNWMFKARIVGHSMGGKTAMKFALKYPDMVEKLVVVDIAPKAYTGGHQEIFEAMLSLDLDAISSRDEAEAQLARRIQDEAVRLFLLKNMSRSSKGGYQWKMNLPVIYEHYQEILSRIDGDTPFEGETLFVRGGRSNYIADSDMPDILRLFPSARLETIPTAGHWIHADAPDEFCEYLHHFLT